MFLLDLSPVFGPVGPVRFASAVLILIFLFSCLLPVSSAAERVRLLAMARDSRFPYLNRLLQSEPAVDFSIILTRDKSLPDSELLKLIRLYFPRTYEDFRKYDVMILAQPTYYLFTPKQDLWIHDSVTEGAGGINDGSVFSQIPGIPEAWSSGSAWQAFPNDAPAVTAEHVSWAPKQSYSVEINEASVNPVLKVFIPFRVEEVQASAVSRLVIPRQGSEVLAWQLGNYAGKEPFLAAWEYEDGRAMTIGEQIPGGWLRYPKGITGENRYSPEIMMNMIFWLAGTELIDDVEVFHRVKTDFSEFRTRIAVLISLKEFIDRFGANTDRIDEEIIPLEEIYSRAADQYLEHRFVDSEDTIGSALARLPQVEGVAREEKERALLWVYIIEWLISSSAFFISGFILWTLMVRRRLYRSVRTTKLRAGEA
jgi:hypothetical protein